MHMKERLLVKELVIYQILPSMLTELREAAQDLEGKSNEDDLE